MSVYAVVKFKNYGGKWASPSEEEKALALFQTIVAPQPISREWSWLRDKLAAWCLDKARAASTQSEQADVWIERYRAIRGIK